MSSPEYEQERWFKTEVQPHEAALRSWLRGQFPSLTDMDDLIQDAYLRVMQIRLDSPGKIYAAKAFLFAVARNLALDQLRHRQIVKFDAIGDVDESVMPDDFPHVADTVGRRQELQLLTEAVQSLPERCRQVITMRKIYGLPQKEIARQLGISEHTVEAQVGLGVKRCVEYLARYGLP